MRLDEEGASCSTIQAIDLIAAVKELHGLSSQELGMLIRDSDNNILRHVTRDGSCKLIDVEKLARFLSLHLVAVLISSGSDDSMFKYLLSGFQLLHSLCELASRHPKLEQILLDDVKVSEQLLDLVFYLLIVLGGYKEGNYASTDVAILHSSLVSCSLYLLMRCISSQWQELVQVLLAHPKVDIFLDVAFAAVYVDIRFLHMQLSVQSIDSCIASGSTALETLKHLCQQCESALQFLQSLCQQKLFRERIVKNKDLYGKGGVLLLAQAIINLNISLFRDSSIVAAVSRLKSKVLSILLHLCEVESVSYLDEVASTPEGLDLAKYVTLQVLELLKEMFGRDSKQFWASFEKIYPKGLLQLNAMRLMDIFSDDSNFRSYITIHFTEVLTEIFSVSHGEFLSSWCSSDLPVWEEDASIEYDSFSVAGTVFELLASSDMPSAVNLEFNFIPFKMPLASYAHQRTSLLVKMIANLHCFVPDICKEEKDLFLNKFVHCLQKEPPKFLDGLSLNCNYAVSRNLRSLLSHAESLIPSFLNDEDVQLLRVFFSQLESMITSAESEVNRVQESHFEGSVSWKKFSKLNITEHHQVDRTFEGCLSHLVTKVNPDIDNKDANLKGGASESFDFSVDHFYAGSNSRDQADGIGGLYKMTDKGQPGWGASQNLREVNIDTQNIETSGSDSSSTRGKNSIDQIDNVVFPKQDEQTKESGSRAVQEDEKVETVTLEEKQRRKRKRTIMNDKQITLIEKALLDEPDMQRNAASIQSWADKLSVHGSEVTTSQLKNWLNNRKARLARAAKDVQTYPEEENPDKQGVTRIGPAYDSSGSTLGDVDVSLTERRIRQGGFGGSYSRPGPSRSTEVTVAEMNPAENSPYKPGRLVLLVDGQSEEIGKGKVYQVHGKWWGRELEESEMCVVDIIELKAERWTRLPHPCDATGNSFDLAEQKFGVMRVLWDTNKLLSLQPRMLEHLPPNVTNGYV